MMKTLQEFYEEIKNNGELKKSLAEAVKSEKITEFLKANGCDATIDEVNKFIAENTAKDQTIELNEDDLEMVAGGLSESDEANLDILKFFCDIFSLFATTTAKNAQNRD